MQIEKMRLIRTAVTLLLIAALVGLGAGCQQLNLNGSQQQESEKMIKVEVHFTGGSQPLQGYVKSLDFEKEGMFFTGGSSTIPLYDEQGNQIALVNYGRVEYYKILP